MTTSFGFAQSLSRIDSLENALEQANSYEEYSATIDELAFTYYYNKPDSTIFYCYKGLPRSKEEKDTNGVGYYHMLMGVSFKNLTQYDSAIYHLKQSIYYREMVGFKAGVAGAYNNLGTVYKLKGNFDKSITYFVKALETFRELEDNENVGEVNSNLGELYIDLEEYELAAACFADSKKSYEKEGNPLAFGWYYYDLGLLKSKIKQPDSALIYYQKAIDVWKPVERVQEYSRCMVKMAEIELKAANYNSSLLLLDEAERGFKKIKYEAGLTDVFILKGDYYYEKDAFKKSLLHYNESLVLAEESASFGQLRQIYRSLYLTNKELKDSERALFYLEKANSLKDSIFGLEQEKIKYQYQTKYDVLSKESEIQNLTKSQEIQDLKVKQTDLKNENQKIGLYALSGGVILVGILVFLLYRRNKVKTALNDELQRSLREREALLREIHHRVKNNLQIVSSLLNLQSGYASQKSAAEILKDSQDRITSMSILHENLYKSENLNDIGFKDYVESLVTNLKSSFNLDEQNITVVQEIEEMHLDMDYLVPCGLIINELVTNSLKYAFGDIPKGEIKITASKKENQYHLSISDNGIGVDEEINPAKLKSLGLRLVNGLVRQMKGQINFPKRDSGFEVNITFKE